MRLDRRYIEAKYVALSKSNFRSSFHLSKKEKAYVEKKGLDEIVLQAKGFIDTRLAPAFIKNDGKQTPMRNHPVFVAQHATATCCRGCLETWHGIQKGNELTSEEKRYILNVIMIWIEKEMQN